MIFKVFTSENLCDLEKVKREAKFLAESEFKEDGYSGFSSREIAIIGEDAIDAFSAKYHELKKEFAPPIKTDGKTSAKAVPFVIGSYHHNIYDGNSVGRFCDFGSYQGITCLVEFCGMLFWPYDRKRQGMPCKFELFNDDTDYRNYLPSEWEKNNPEPNKVGMLTDKKMKAWRDWLLARKEAAEKEKKEKHDNVSAFLARIAEIPESECQMKDVGVAKGKIIRNGLCFSWLISNGVVYENLEVHYTTAWKDGKDKLTAFNEMCEGKYVSKI